MSIAISLISRFFPAFGHFSYIILGEELWNKPIMGLNGLRGWEKDYSKLYCTEISIVLVYYPRQMCQSYLGLVLHVTKIIKITI